MVATTRHRFYFFISLYHMDLIERAFRETYPPKMKYSLTRDASRKLYKYSRDLTLYICQRVPSLRVSKMIAYEHKLLLPVLKTRKSRILIRVASIKKMAGKKTTKPPPIKQVKLLGMIVRNFLKIIFKDVRNEIKNNSKIITVDQIKKTYRRYTLKKIYKSIYITKVAKHHKNRLLGKDIAILRKKGIRMFKYVDKAWQKL